MEAPLVPSQMCGVNGTDKNHKNIEVLREIETKLNEKQNIYQTTEVWTTITSIMNGSLGIRPCALIREFSLSITHPQWRYGTPSAFALLNSKEYQNYIRLTQSGGFVGEFDGFVFMYEFVCEIYHLS